MILKGEFAKSPLKLNATNINMSARLRRSQSDKMISGVCGGIAAYLSWDSTFVRILFVIITLLGFFAPVLVYFILALVMPE